MIGVLNGPALAHSELALLCDVVLASETATIQDQPHFGNGVAPGDGVHIVLPLLMGMNPGRYFLLTQQVLDAREARAAGLVSEVLSPKALLPRARALAAMMVSKPPLALRYARQLLTHKLKQAIEDALPHGLAVEGLSRLGQSPLPVAAIRRRVRCEHCVLARRRGDPRRTAVRWLTPQGGLPKPRLGTRMVAHVVKRRCKAVSIDPEHVAGHSLRRSFATAAARAKKLDRMIKRHGRWKSAAMLDRYIEDGTRWDDNATVGLGL